MLKDGLKYSWDAKRPFVSRPRRQYLRGNAFNPNAAVEARYYRELAVLIRHMAREVGEESKRLFETDTAKQTFAQDDTLSAQARILFEALKRKFDGIFHLAAPLYAARMARAESHASTRSLEHSLKKLSGGLTLKTDVITGNVRDVLEATVAENVALIKSIPAQYFTQIEGAVMRSISNGRGLADLVPFLKDHAGVTLRRARIIARDQTLKAFSNLNFARMADAGIKEYEWLHSGGGKEPRKLHVAMSGNIYRMDKPPIIDEKTGQRGKPGDLINCRCRAIPIIRFETEI